MRAAIYLRSATGTAERQELPCRALADELGWKVVVVERDDHHSATAERPGYRGLLNLICAGEVEAVVTHDISRLVRRAVDLAELLNVVTAHGVEVRCVEGMFDPTGLLLDVGLTW